MSSTTELTGLVPGVGVLLFEADSESNSDSGREPGLWGTPPPNLWMYELTVWAVRAVHTNRTLFSQKSKSNKVTWGFLNIISGWCSIRFTPAFSTPAIYCCFSTPAFSVAPVGRASRSAVCCARMSYRHAPACWISTLIAGGLRRPNKTARVIDRYACSQKLIAKRNRYLGNDTKRNKKKYQQKYRNIGYEIFHRPLFITIDKRV